MLEILLGPRRTPRYNAPLLFARAYSTPEPDINQSFTYFEEMPSISFASGNASDNSPYVDSTALFPPVVTKPRGDVGQVWFTVVPEEG